MSFGRPGPPYVERHSLCRPDWFNRRLPPVSGLQVLGLKLCTTTASQLFQKNRLSDYFILSTLSWKILLVPFLPYNTYKLHSRVEWLPRRKLGCWDRGRQGDRQGEISGLLFRPASVPKSMWKFHLMVDAPGCWTKKIWNNEENQHSHLLLQNSSSLLTTEEGNDSGQVVETRKKIWKATRLKDEKLP